MFASGSDGLLVLVSDSMMRYVEAIGCWWGGYLIGRR